ncbi:MAG: hypothetical protein VX498_13450, partial [Myxococcota bacterium]|nr:hypothetical protein [Myxococcota bacterium]
FLFKPYALGLILTRPLRQAALPLAVGVALFSNTSGRGSFVNLDTLRNAAPIRALQDLGLPLPWWALAGAVLSFAAIRLRGQDARALCAAWLALPLAWAHTVLLVFPALAWALRRAWLQPAGERRNLGLVALLFCGVVLFQPTYFGSTEGSGLLGGLLGLLPGLAVLGVAVAAGPGPRPR